MLTWLAITLQAFCCKLLIKKQTTGNTNVQSYTETLQHQA